MSNSATRLNGLSKRTILGPCVLAITRVDSYLYALFTAHIDG